MLCNCSIKGFEFTFGAPFFFLGLLAMLCCFVFLFILFHHLLNHSFVLLLLWLPFMFHIVTIVPTLDVSRAIIVKTLCVIIVTPSFCVAIVVPSLHTSHYFCCDLHTSCSHFTLLLLCLPFILHIATFAFHVHVPSQCTCAFPLHFVLLISPSPLCL